MDEQYKIIVQRIFNNWTGLRLAVEHGMGGRGGHKTAIDIMNYMYEYCVGNKNLSQSELQEVLEDLMDEEFDTVCEDNSIPEICFHLLKYWHLCQENKLDEIEAELNKLPNVSSWLRPDAQIVHKRVENDSSSEYDTDDADDGMEVDEPATTAARSSKSNEEDPNVEPGWTVVSTKKRK